MDSIDEMKKKFAEKKKAMKAQKEAQKVGESEDILLIDDDKFQLTLLDAVLLKCGYSSDSALGGVLALERYQSRVKTFIEGMKQLEYVSISTASSKYLSVEMLFENLKKNAVSPPRFIISDYNMPDMMGH